MPPRPDSDRVPRPAAPLLSFAAVRAEVRDGTRAVTVLRDIDFVLPSGGSAGIYGARRSGKSTLLRLACGLDLPHEGEVHIQGLCTRELDARERSRLLRESVALLDAGRWLPAPAESALDHVVTSLGSRRVSLRQGRQLALAALDRVGVAACAHDLASSLGHGERARVMLAAALVREPSMLLVDEPAPQPSLAGREEFCSLLRTVARERGIGLLVASEDLSALQGLGTLLSLSAGELCSGERQGSVVSLVAARAASGR